MHGGLHAMIDGRVGEDGFVVQQVALRIKADHLTTRAETGVDTHHALLSQWRTKQQLTQILGKYADSLFVSLLLAEVHELCLYRGQQQALVTVLYGLCHQSLAGSVATNIVTLQTLYGLVVVDSDADAQYTLALATTHSQQPMTGTALQRLFPLKVVAVFLRLVAVFLSFYNL